MRMSTKQIKKYYISIDNELERDTYETNLNVLLWKSVIQELIKALFWKKNIQFLYHLVKTLKNRYNAS